LKEATPVGRGDKVTVYNYIFCSFATLSALIVSVVGADRAERPDIASGTGGLRGRVELQNLVIGDSRIISKDISGIYQKTAPPLAGATSAYEPLNFVVYIEDAPAAYPDYDLPEKQAKRVRVTPTDSGAYTKYRVVMDQRELTFVPHVLPILAGSTVEFPNSDPVYHNVFSYSKAKTFDLGRYPTGHSKAVTFDKPGVVKVYCDMHSQMNAFILVLANPFFTLTDEHGDYLIREVPAGTYNVKAWFARLPEKTASVTIRPGETTTLNFVFP
jgi:plastocyanin